MVTCLHQVAHGKKLMVTHPNENSLLHLFLCVAIVSASFFVSNTPKINLFMRGSPFKFFSTKLTARLPSSEPIKIEPRATLRWKQQWGSMQNRIPGYTQIETAVGINAK